MHKRLVALFSLGAFCAASFVGTTTAAHADVKQTQRSETVTIGTCTFETSNGPLGGSGYGGFTGTNDRDCAAVGIKVYYLGKDGKVLEQPWAYVKSGSLNLTKYSGTQPVFKTVHFAKDKSGTEGTTTLLSSDRLASYRTKALTTARAEIGKAGAYSEGGFWCAKFVSYVNTTAKVPGYVYNDAPAGLYGKAQKEGRIVGKPSVGGEVFVDLFAGQYGANYVNHIGIVESVKGNTFTSIERSPDDNSKDVVVRKVRTFDDPHVIAFSRMG
jgi:hypothetical protein